MDTPERGPKNGPFLSISPTYKKGIVPIVNIKEQENVTSTRVCRKLCFGYKEQVTRISSYMQLLCLIEIMTSGNIREETVMFNSPVLVLKINVA